ncbi:hypothetical protein L1049_009228 [Liquidambar formosana]|uniref:Nodulation-signaling pathway 2 protein n=1 Tax=Liquidambar formosana TaxID=63359 RepID=A0AAP0S8L7_LIQFO
MQPELLQPSWLQPSWPSYNNIMDSALDQVDQVGLYGLNMDDYVTGGFQLSSSLTNPEDSSGISSSPYFPPVFSSEFVKFPVCDDAPQVESAMDDFLLDVEGFEHTWSGEIEGACGFLAESEGSFPSQQLSINGEDEWSPCASMKSSDASMDITSIQQSLTLPGEEKEVDNQLSMLHLLKAYGEAMEKEQRELAEVIVRCINEKVSPLGETVERLAFNLFEDMENQSDYLKQESHKNFEAAFKTFYQIFPYGRFAHFAANSAILEAVPADAEMIHIVDFDIGDGVQWPPMIEAFGRQKKAVRLTSIKWREEDYSYSPSHWRFEETKRRLYNHARSIGLNLKVEEMEIENLVSETKKTKKRGGRGEWLAFNCMVGLPHMGKGRSRRHVMEFLRVAKELISTSADCSASNRGVITFGEGDAGEKLKNCTGFGSFFDGCLAHYQTLFESMEWNFPIHLAEARIAMEFLFLAPYVSSLAWFQKWEDIREGCDLQAGIGLVGWRLSKESLLEAKVMVQEGESSYRVTFEEDRENEMVLQWRGTPLVKFSTWI